MKFKLTKNILLIGLLIGIIFYCTINNCSFREGLKDEKKNSLRKRFFKGIKNRLGKGMKYTKKKIGKGAVRMKGGLKSGIIKTGKFIGGSIKVLKNARNTMKEYSLTSKEKKEKIKKEVENEK